MAYNTKWVPDRCFESWKQAEQAALLRGEAPLGFLYRFTEQTYASLDPYKYEWGNDDDYDFVTYIELEAIPIRSATPCGWTIKASNGLGWRFISKDSVKRYALPTVMEALESYVARKKKQAAIYEARAKKAQWLMDKVLGNTRLPFG